ncbi:MAG TPA: MotA/TolQ/ExbB proton channel family protein [Chitinophagales bacterium]|nr:MotA/TolQ/ExbB proton channel family protein [Chitinophagales bacterium]
MSNTAKSTPQASNKGAGSIFPLIVIPLAIVLGFIIWKVILGTPANFKDGNTAGEPLPGSILGMMYKGGFIVPILIAQLLIVITFCIERFITIARAAGVGSMDAFLRKVMGLVDKNDISAAMAECNKQKGSLGNVVYSGLHKYREMQSEASLEKDQKVLAITKEVEEATTLELPMLEKNLNILATIASVATLFGLLGTVIGMIRAFAALSVAGSPDASALATGISEALINTALGIGTSAIAIIAYNYFTNRIDGLTYRIDEAGYSLTQAFASSQK